MSLKDFQTIVNIDSSSDHLPGIETVARFFQKRFSAIGLKADVLFQGDAKVPCLQAVAGPGRDENGYDLMFLGHMDTVFPFGEVGAEVDMFKQAGQLHTFCNTDCWEKAFPVPITPLAGRQVP